MINLQRKLLHLFRESPKVGFLLIIGALILFPLYMMVVISLMTPAQLERFPWFPMKFDQPRDLTASRQADVQLQPARLRLEPLVENSGTASPAPDDLRTASREIPILMNERFYFHMPGNDGQQMQWQVKPQDGKRVVIAEYRASMVCQVREPQPGIYMMVVAGRRDEGDQQLQVPEGFTSLVEGLRQRALMNSELSACEQARKEATDVLKSAERITRIDNEDERTRRRQEAALHYLLARRYLELGHKAFKRAAAYAEMAESGGVAARDRIEDARRRIDLAERRLAAAGKIVGAHAESLPADVIAAAHLIKDTPADVSTGFIIDRGDAVAVLTTDVPMTVTRLPGRAVLKTAWQYQYDPPRPFIVDRKSVV